MQTTLIDPTNLSIQSIKNWIDENTNPALKGSLQSRVVSALESLKEFPTALTLFLDVVYFCTSRKKPEGQSLRRIIIENSPTAWEWYVTDPNQKMVGEIAHEQVISHLNPLRQVKQWTLRELLESFQVGIRLRQPETQLQHLSLTDTYSPLSYASLSLIEGEHLSKAESLFQELTSQDMAQLPRDDILCKVADLHWNLARSIQKENRQFIEMVIIFLLLKHEFMVTPYEEMDGYTRALLYGREEFIREYGFCRKYDLLMMASSFQLKLLKRIGGMQVFMQLPAFNQVFPITYKKQNPLPPFKDFDPNKLTSRVMKYQYFGANQVILAKDQAGFLHLFCQKEVGKGSWHYQASNDVKTDPSLMPIKKLFHNLYQEPWFKECDRSWFRGSEPLERSHQALAQKSQALKQKMTHESIWDDSSFIQEVSKFMEEAYAEVELFYRELINITNGDLKKMAEVMNHQQRKKGQPNFCYSYFKDSLTEMYHFARSRASLDDCKRSQTPWLAQKDIDPYFQSGTPQYHWRELYTKFCQKLDEHQLRDALSDSRFSQWTQPDNNPTEEFTF